MELLGQDKHRMAKADLGMLDFMMGNFNFTKDPIDKAPTKIDNEQAIDALKDLRFKLKMQDSWRIENPN
jgi:hypothetical protein